MINNSFKISLASLFTLLFTILIVNNICAQTPEDISKKMTDVYGLALIKEQQTLKDIESVKKQRETAEEDLKDVGEDKHISSEVLKTKKKLMSQLLQKQKFLSIEERENQKLLAKISDLINKDATSQERFIADYEAKNGAIGLPATTVYDEILAPIPNKRDDADTGILNPMAKTENDYPEKDKSINTEETTLITEKGKLKKKKVSDKKPIEKLTTVDYDEKTNVMIHPPVTPCRIVFDSTDVFTGKRKKESARTLFFTQTDDLLKKMMKDKDYITCYAVATRIQGGITFLNLTFIIQSKETQKVFGFLEKGSPIVFRLMNGHTFNFTNSSTDIGVVDFLRNTTTFQATIQLYANDIKSITSSELDQVRVAWSAGVDDYEIYDVNILKNLLRCVE